VTLSLRRALAAAAATATLLAVAGCNGDDSDAQKASDEPAAESSGTTDASDDAATPDDEDGDDAEAGEGTELTGPEFADLVKTALDNATTAHVTMELGGAGSGEGDADYTKNPPDMAMKLTMDALGGDVEVRLVAGTMYMKSPAFGEKWVSIPLDDPNSPMGALGSQFDVKQQFELFAKAVTSATHVGTEDVDGESLEHYTATVDAEKMLESLPSAAAGQVDVPDSMTQDWWFDDEGLIRKFSSDFSGSTTTMTLSDWGSDVTIEAPPADEVTTMPGSAG
jgi:hypothetical protein